ncbi:MAG: FAD-binding protein [Ferruginibacter sp.]
MPTRKSFLKTLALSSAAAILKPFSGYAMPFFPYAPSGNVDYFQKADQRYDELRKGFNKRISRSPQIIALCYNTAGVQEAVQYAVKSNLKIAVKSGGHCMEGFSGSEGGMQVIVSQLNKLEWLGEFQIKTGPGCLLKDIYAELVTKGKILPGGSCGTVAIGGLTLGGGYGLMSRLFGLTADSLLEVTMVDAAGNIINSANDPELLWACRGGGNGNFGIITEMKFKVHTMPRSMSSYRFKAFKLNVIQAKNIMQTWFAETQKLPNACFSALLFNGNTAYILLTNVSKHTPAVEQFVRAMSAVTQKHTANLRQPLGAALKVFYGEQHPVKFKNASAGLYRSFADIEAISGDILQIVLNTKGMIYQLNTLGGAIQLKEFEAASSFPHRTFPYFSELQTYWGADARGEVLMQRFQQVQDIIAAHGITAQYRNYPDINFKNPLQQYYGNNLARLMQVKEKYNKLGFIAHPQSFL